MPPDSSPYDTFSQLTGELALSASGFTRTEDKIIVNARRIDLWYRADPQKNPPPGLLGRLLNRGTHILEFYHQPPSIPRWRECM